jgi:hypothetical protein
LGVKSFLFDENVRIRPSGRGKVLEKKELLINNSWNVVNPIVCRALPEFVEPAQNEQPARFMMKCYDKQHADFDRNIPVVNPFDGHHRLLAAAELEAEGIGPDSVGKENPVPGFYVVPCYVLKPDCPDHIARAIALALTQNELKTHANNTIGILHVVRKTQEDLQARRLPFAASDVMLCLNAAAHGDSVITLVEVEMAQSLLTNLLKTTERGVLVYDEVIELAGRDQQAVYTKMVSLVESAGLVEFKDVCGLSMGLPGKCFLPPLSKEGGKAGRYDSTKGGFVPTGKNQTVFNLRTSAEEVLAVMRAAYGYWVMTGGDYMPKQEYVKLTDPDNPCYNSWRDTQDEDVILLRTEFAKCYEKSEPDQTRDAEHRLLEEVMEVLVMETQREKAHGLMENWKQQHSSLDFTKSESCFARLTTRFQVKIIEEDCTKPKPGDRDEEEVTDDDKDKKAAKEEGEEKEKEVEE